MSSSVQDMCKIPITNNIFRKLYIWNYFHILSAVVWDFSVPGKYLFQISNILGPISIYRLVFFSGMQIPIMKIRWSHNNHLIFLMSMPILIRQHLCIEMVLRPGPLLNIKTIFPRYGDSHVKDKMVSQPSYLKHGDTYTGKTTSLYWDGPQIIQGELVKDMGADWPGSLCCQVNSSHGIDYVE